MSMGAHIPPEKCGTSEQWLETNRLATGGTLTRQFSTPTTDTRFCEATPGGHPYRVRTWTDNRGKVVHEYWTVDGMGLVRWLLAGILRRPTRTQRHPGHVLILLPALAGGFGVPSRQEIIRCN